MGKITYKECISILEGFIIFISDKKKGTRDQYKDIVKEYLLNEVYNQVEQENYESIFLKEKILDFQKFKRGMMVRAALGNLRDYLIGQGKLIKFFDFEYPVVCEKNKVDKKIIHIDDVREIIFGADTKFRTQEEKVVTQCISAICYFCLFEQKHIEMLRCSDILISEARIKNLRAIRDSEEGLVRWISLNEETLKYIKEYVEYLKIDMFTEDIFFRMSDNTPFNNLCQNKLFSNYKLKENGFLSIGAQLLNYSMIYHYLVATKGRGSGNILQIVGFSNEQFKRAIKEYVTEYGVLYNPNSMIEVMSLSDIKDNYEKAVQVYENDEDMEEDEETVEDISWLNVCNKYTEESDIGMEDILNFDSMNDNNQEKKDIHLSRLVRSTLLAENLKNAYNNRCQLCGTRLMKTRVDAYSEAHHIRPYNSIHKGDDTASNMIVLCPNCHSQFDNLYYAIHPSTKLVHCQDEADKFHLFKMEFLQEHFLEATYLNYAWIIFKKK